MARQVSKQQVSKQQTPTRRTSTPEPVAGVATPATRSSRTSATSRSTSTTTSTTPARRSGAGTSRSAVVPGTNLVVVRGEVRVDPDRRIDAAGVEVLSFDLIVRSETGPAESVPMLWEDSGLSTGTGTVTGTVTAGAELVVIGRVRRRFFRVGAATATRTEVGGGATS